MSRLLLVLSVLAATFAAASAAAAAGPPRLLGCAGKPLVRPAGTVVLACADANTLIRSTRWTSWTRSGATGTTDLGVNLCNPYCAASRMSFFPRSRIRLTGAKRTRHGLLFTRALITYVAHGKTKTLTAYLAS